MLHCVSRTFFSQFNSVNACMVIHIERNFRDVHLIVNYKSPSLKASVSKGLVDNGGLQVVTLQQ